METKKKTWYMTGEWKWNEKICMDEHDELRLLGKFFSRMITKAICIAYICSFFFVRWIGEQTF